jgi:hypothetical protein
MIPLKSLLDVYFDHSMVKQQIWRSFNETLAQVEIFATTFEAGEGGCKGLV